MNDPFYADFPSDPFGQNAFNLSKAWNNVFAAQTSGDDKQDDEIEKYTEIIENLYMDEDQEVTKKRVLVEIMENFDC